jgi:voltage-gated potassium channel Kch
MSTLTRNEPEAGSLRRFLKRPGNWAVFLLVAAFMAVPFYALDGAESVVRGAADVALAALASAFGCFVAWNAGVRNRLFLFLSGAATTCVLYFAHGLDLGAEGFSLWSSGLPWSAAPFVIGGSVLGFVVTLVERDKYSVRRGALGMFAGVAFMTLMMGVPAAVLGRVTVTSLFSAALYAAAITMFGNLIGFFAGVRAVTPALREFARASAYLRAVAPPAAGFLLVYLTAAFLFALCYQGALKLDPNAFARPEGAGLSLGDLFYFSVVTLTTVGYGDIAPKSPLAKSLVGAEMIASVGLLVIAFPSVLAYLQPRFEEITKRLREEEGNSV